MKIALFGKTLAPENGEYMRQLFKELADNKVEIVVYEPFASIIVAHVPEDVHYSVFQSHADLKADLLFSIGGDGTILDTVPYVLDSGIPVVGINMGRLGFLSSISKNEITMAVNSVLTGEYTVEQRTLLANVYRALMQFVAEQERKNIALRTGKGRSIKAACGGYSGGRCPYGYEVVEHQLVINEAERPIVEFVFQEYDKGTPMLRIADMLTDSGRRTRKGTRFQVSSIKSILSNRPLYEGKYKYGKDMNWVDGVHEPILKAK